MGQKRQEKTDIQPEWAGFRVDLWEEIAFGEIFQAVLSFPICARIT